MTTFNSFADWQNYGDGSTSFMDQYLAKIDANTAAANAFNASQAQKQMDFQVEQNAKAMEFNHREAELNRNWQEMMSNTAHQREVQDLLAAGLNPVLSATGGNGAPVTSGATAAGVTSSGSKAEADTSRNASLTGMLGSLVQSTAQRDIADLNAVTSMRNADIAAAAQKYASDQLRLNVLDQIANDRYMAEHYPNNFYTLLADFLAGLLEGKSIPDVTSSAFDIVKDTAGKVTDSIKNLFHGIKLPNLTLPDLELDRRLQQAGEGFKEGHKIDTALQTYIRALIKYGVANPSAFVTRITTLP